MQMAAGDEQEPDEHQLFCSLEYMCKAQLFRHPLSRCYNTRKEGRDSTRDLDERCGFLNSGSFGSEI
jgi:hypothetical protein